jgi:hypothetical protein
MTITMSKCEGGSIGQGEQAGCPYRSMSAFGTGTYTQDQKDDSDCSCLNSRERVVIEITLRIEHNSVQDHVHERLHHPVSYRTTNRSEPD